MFFVVLWFAQWPCFCLSLDKKLCSDLVFLATLSWSQSVLVWCQCSVNLFMLKGRTPRSNSEWRTISRPPLREDSGECIAQGLSFVSECNYLWSISYSQNKTINFLFFLSVCLNFPPLSFQVLGMSICWGHGTSSFINWAEDGSTWSLSKDLLWCYSLISFICSKNK